MENAEINQIIDIRQSPQWSEYLKQLGWQKHTLGEHRNFHTLKTGPLVIAKIQRPARLSTDDFIKLDELARLNRLTFIKFELSLNQEPDLLTQSGYQLSLSPLCPPSTIFIDLKKATADLESGLSRTARYSIHRAKKDGGKVEVYSHPKADLLDQIYPILKATAHHQKFYLPGIGNLKTKLTLWQNECYVALVKNAQGILCGANVFLGFQGNVWYLHSGITAEGRKANLGYFLLWQSILYLKTRGYNFLDLEGKNDCRFPSFTKTWGGFSFFKERFGGTQVCFPAPQIKYYSKAFKFLSRVYNSAMPL